ncbi:MAG: bifunctional metallophosphatase/5'-nucleotidase [Deltaproteobacteria bacterium]|nr:bifunctional metallophosphatase/5'-nucleotidase [Deltaproteobacteria bacterium]
MSRSLWIALVALAACKPSAPAAPAEPLAGPVTLHIAALNDFHGSIYEIPVKGDPAHALGGLPWVAAAMSELRAEHPDLILLDAGDSFQGSWPVNNTQGMAQIEAYNYLGVDVTEVGNHDFDYGGVEGGDPVRGALYRAVATANYPFVVSNIQRADTGERWEEGGIRPWVMVERGGVKLAVTGVITQDTPQTTHASHVADLRFASPAESVRALIPEMKAAGAHAIAVLAHLEGECQPPPGFAEPSTDCAVDGELGAFLAALPPEVDLVLGGHAHTLIANRIGGALVVESRAKGQMIGRVDLVVGPEGVDREASAILPFWVLSHDAVEPGCTGGDFPLDARDLGGRTVAPDPTAVAMVKAMEDQAGTLCEQVGCSTQALGRARVGESAVGDLFSDALLAVYPQADLAVANAGGLRADLPAGPLLKEHLHAVMPFDNEVMLVEMTGAQVELLLQIGSSGSHGQMNLANGSYVFDPTAVGGRDLDGDGAVAEWETDRLCEARVGGAALDPDRRYKVVVTDFLFKGGDHLGPAFEGATVLDEGMLAREALMKYVAGQEWCLGERAPVMDPAAPRIAEGSCAQ